MASKLLYSVLVFDDVLVLRQVADVVQANATLASYGRYLCLDQQDPPWDGNEIDEGEGADIREQAWADEMCRLVSLLPDLTTLRGGGGWDVEPLVELLACPPRHLETIIDLPFTVKSLPVVTALLERSSATLRCLGLWYPDGPEPSAGRPVSTYPRLVFPLLRRIDFGHVTSPLLYQLASRWTIPSLDTVGAGGVPCLLPFLEVHGKSVVQLGLDNHSLGRDVTFDQIAACCPHLKTLALQVVDRVSTLTSPGRPLGSVTTINVCRSPDIAIIGEQDEYLPSLITKSNFPSLARVRYSTELAGISKTSVLLVFLRHPAGSDSTARFSSGLSPGAEP